jgi:ATP-dependent Clp protease ATP-binding subunit ClpB
VILFDEIEKAHPDVLNLLLQMLDDGRLTDSQGRVVNFRNTVIIMTSNIGSQLIVEADTGTDPEAWGLVEAQVLEMLRRHFRPEFLNRVDDIIVFRQLTREDLGRIVDLQLARLEALLDERHLRLEVTQDVREFLADQGYDPVYGARPLKRVIQRELQNPIALEVLEGIYGDGDTIRVELADGKVGFAAGAAGAARAAGAVAAAGAGAADA